MSKMFKLTLLALVSAFLVGCGSEGDGNDPKEADEIPQGGEIPRTVQGYFPDFNNVNADYTIEIFTYYPMINTIFKDNLQSLADNGFTYPVGVCFVKDSVDIRAAGCMGQHGNEYAILDFVKTSRSSDSQVMDISESLFSSSNFPNYNTPSIGIQMYKNFGTKYSSETFENYGNSLTASPYNFIPTSSSCWQKTKNGFVYLWCHDYNSGVRDASWYIIKEDSAEAFVDVQSL
jgi:hypothetical protein